MHPIQFPILNPIRGKGDIFLPIPIPPPIRPTIVAGAGRQLRQPRTIRLDRIQIKIAVPVAGEHQSFAIRRPGRIQILPRIIRHPNQRSIGDIQRINFRIAIAVRHESRPPAVRRKRGGNIRSRMTGKPRNQLRSQIQQINVEIIPARRRIPVGTERQQPAPSPRRPPVIGGMTGKVDRTGAIAPHHINFPVAIPIGLKSDPPARRIPRRRSRRRGGIRLHLNNGDRRRRRIGFRFGRRNRG